MPVIAVVNQKGGTGKTTISTLDFTQNPGKVMDDITLCA